MIMKQLVEGTTEFVSVEAGKVEKAGQLTERYESRVFSGLKV